MKNNSLTLLLVLKGRHDFTDRWLKYANLYLNDYKILIADGNELNDKYIYDKLKFPNLEVEIPKFPHDQSIELFIRKIRNSLDYIDTKYILYCENDDFMLPDETKNVLEFLEKNDDYVSARGEIFNFSISSINEVYGKIIQFNRFYNFLDLNETDVIKRIKTFAKNRHGLFHNIMKCTAFKEVTSTVIENKFFDLVIFQYFWSFSLPTIGKVHCTKNLYMMHQDHASMMSRNSNIMRFDKSLFYNEEKFNNFFSALANSISSRHNIELDDLEFKLLNMFSYNELLNIIKSNGENHNERNQTIKKLLIKLIRKNRLSNYILNFKKRRSVDYKIKNSLNLKIIQNFLLKE